MKEFIQRNMPVVVIGGLTVLVFLGIILLSQTKPQTTTPQLVPLDEKEWIADYTPVLGVKTSPVTLVEFSDFECPACKMMHPIVRDLYFMNEGKLKVAFRHYPLPQHKSAKLAAEAAMVANKAGKFWQYADKLYENQENLSKSDLLTYAENLGFDRAKFEQDLNSGDQSKYVKEDMDLGTRLKVNATPTFYLNGVKMEYQTIQEFKDLVNKALQESSQSTQSN